MEQTGHAQPGPVEEEEQQQWCRRHRQNRPCQRTSRLAPTSLRRERREAVPTQAQRAALLLPACHHQAFAALVTLLQQHQGLTI